MTFLKTLPNLDADVHFASGVFAIKENEASESRDKKACSIFSCLTDVILRMY
jgi:hypothetical protein